MIKGILFDFDGTLVDSLNSFLKAYKKALLHFNISVSKKQVVKKCFSKTEEEVCHYFKIKDISLFTKIYFNSINQFSKRVELFPGVLETIKFCHHKHLKIGVASFAYKHYIDQMLLKFHLKNQFEVILTADDVKNNKPHPEMALKACKRINILPKNTLIVGDSKGDLKMAKAAKCQSALFFPKKHKLFYNLTSLEKIKPDYIFSTFFDLKNHLSLYSIPSS